VHAGQICSETSWFVLWRHVRTPNFAQKYKVSNVSAEHPKSEKSGNRAWGEGGVKLRLRYDMHLDRSRAAQNEVIFGGGGGGVPVPCRLELLIPGRKAKFAGCPGQVACF
jgi:hypothetical protein